jgi:hypothetical protein
MEAWDTIREPELRAYLSQSPNSGGPFSSTGNGFADLLVGYINAFVQPNQNLKYYNRYKVMEPLRAGRLALPSD